MKTAIFIALVPMLMMSARTANAERAHSAKTRHIIFIAGTPSHPTLMHEYNAGCLLLKKCLAGVKGVETMVYTNGWPNDPHALDNADAVMLFMDGGGGHGAIKEDHLEQLDRLIKKGVGLGCVHYAVELPADKGGKEFQQWIGGYYESNFSCNPMWEPNFQTFPKHPISRGLKPFQIRDEWYFNMRFLPEMKGITSILVAKPSDSVRDGPYVYPSGPYPQIQAAKGRDEAMMWAVERPDGGRGFGFTGAHFHMNWGNDDFRRAVLNGLLWIAHADVPKNGVESNLTQEDLMANLDDKPDRKK